MVSHEQSRPLARIRSCSLYLDEAGCKVGSLLDYESQVLVEVIITLYSKSLDSSTAIEKATRIESRKCMLI